MKITLLTDGIYPFAIGGMQKHSFLLTKYLAWQHVEVNLYHCIYPDSGLEGEYELFSENEAKRIKDFSFNFPQLDTWPGHYVRESKMLSEIYLQHYLENKSDDDLIYAQGFTAYAFLKAKQRGVELPPVFVNLHGLEIFQRPLTLNDYLQKLTLRSIAKFNIKNADYTISLGGKLTDILKKFTSEEKIIEIPNAIDTAWLRDACEMNSTPRTFTFIGRNEKRKGLKLLNEVLKEINSDFTFNFIGEIHEYDRISSEVSTQFIYHGELKSEEKIKDVLQNSDVLVLPSFSEGMPTVILEAMASGCAIIASDVGAVAEQVDSSNGWLIEAGNKVQIKNAIESAVEIDNEMLYQMKLSSMQKIKEKFLWKNVAGETLRLLKEKL